jgi:DNA-binding NtrC family response regulator
VKPDSIAGRVLLVDDSPNWRRALQRILTQAGHTTETAGSFEEALACMEGASFDVAIVDLVLEGDYPHEREGLRLLREIEPACRIEGAQMISITGYFTPEEVKEELKRLGVIEQLEKNPFQQSSFLGAVRRGLERAQKAREGDEP